jgi:integrase
MRGTLFKPKRNGKESKQYVLRVHRRPGEKPMQIPLHVSLKENAEKRKREILLEMEREDAGLALPKHQREAAKRGLSAHLEEYVQHMKQKRLAPAHIKGEENRLLRIFKECRWKATTDIKRDSFERWLCSLTDCVAKTRNDYLGAARTFTTWLVRRERLAFNPLAGIEKAKVKGNEAKNRRAYTRTEAERLLVVSGPRAIVYRTAMFTGLRRGELEKLEWRDLDLDGEQATFRARAATTKNGKEARLPLNPELAAHLKAFRPEDVKGMDKVFKGLIDRKIAPLQNDLKKAGIPYVDANGETADFHSFRHTFITWLRVASVSKREAMKLARLSEERLLDHIYTDESQLEVTKSVKLLPSFPQSDSPYYSPKFGRLCPAASNAVQTNNPGEGTQEIGNQQVVTECPGLSSPVVDKEMVRDTGFEPVTPTMSR